MILHVPTEYDTPMEMVFKTEFLTLLSEKYEAATSRQLQVKFGDHLSFQVKKGGWGGGGTRDIEFHEGQNWEVKPSGKKLLVSSPRGLPPDSSSCLCVCVFVCLCVCVFVFVFVFVLWGLSLSLFLFLLCLAVAAS